MHIAERLFPTLVDQFTKGLLHEVAIEKRCVISPQHACTGKACMGWKWTRKKWGWRWLLTRRRGLCRHQIALGK